MTITQIRILLLIVFITFIFYAAAAALAQNVVIQVYDPRSPVLRANSLLQMSLPRLESNLSQPIQKKLDAYHASLLFQESGLIFIKPERAGIKELKNQITSREVFKLFYNKPEVDEKANLRREWEQAFGFDVWSPYYKYKEIEKLVKKKFSVQVFKLKGEPRLEKGKILYVFAATF